MTESNPKKIFTAGPPATRSASAASRALIVLASLLLAAPAIAQDLEAEVLAKVREATGDADALTEVALWARENGLESDAERILIKVLGLDSRHTGARRALKNMGLVEFDGVWIEDSKEHMADAKEGIFHHGEELVSLEELAAYQTGKVRHPATGEFIPEEDAHRAEGLYPLGDGEWGTLKEANEYHSDPEHPWVVRTRYTTLVSTMPLGSDGDDEGSVRWAWGYVDWGYLMVNGMFGISPRPANRPVICMTASFDEYSGWGDAFGGADSSYAVFVLDQNEQEFSVPGVPPSAVPVFVNYAEEELEGVHLRHAGALATIEALRRDIDAPRLQPWFVRGIGACAGRLSEPNWAGENGEWDVTNNGGVHQNLSRWFESFGLGGGMEWKAMAHNVFQAGLMIRFAEDFGQGGPERRVSDRWKEVVEVFQKGNGRRAWPAIERLQTSYYRHADEIRTYLRWLIAQEDD